MKPGRINIDDTPALASSSTKTPWATILCNAENAALRSAGRRVHQLQAIVITLPPPKDWDIRFGQGLIEKHCASIDDYGAVTSPTAYAAAKSQLHHEPKGVFYPTSQESDFNEAMVQTLPRTRFVLGISVSKLPPLLGGQLPCPPAWHDRPR